MMRRSSIRRMPELLLALFWALLGGFAGVASGFQSLLAQPPLRGSSSSISHPFAEGTPPRYHRSSSAASPPLMQSFEITDDAPSDYDVIDLEDEKTATVDLNEEDAMIRDALKRELLVLSSVTNRGEYATLDEQNALVDLVSQLEALNPTADPASNSEGEWDLGLASTQFFRSSPFFQSIRVAAGDANKEIVENGFDLHDRSTTFGRVGRVRQTLTKDKLVSEVDLEVGLLPGLPIRIKGNVITTASLEVVASDTFETRIESTHVEGSNIPFLNEWLDDPRLELRVGDFYRAVRGDVPVVSTKTFYVDEAMRIVRDVDDNFFVFTRS